MSILKLIMLRKWKRVCNYMNRSIYIYGMGEYGKTMLHLLRKMGISVAGFIVTNSKGVIITEGITVIEYNDFIKQMLDGVVLIAISDNDTTNQIIARFVKDGYEEKNIMRMASFIRDNDEGNFCKCMYFGNDEMIFTEFGVDSELFKLKRIIGGGKRKNSRCPICGTIDRHRWLNWLLSNKTGIYNDPCRVLHFAPEKILRRFITLNSQCDYYPGDINMKNGLHRIDVTNIQFKDNFFDYIIINHVLEHVQNEEKALNELRRVLSKSGKLIISFPIAVGEKTFDDKSIVTDEERLKFYGQTDHVRLYGDLDAGEHLVKYGFDVDKYQVKDYFSEEDTIKYGLIYDDIVFICTKK